MLTTLASSRRLALSALALAFVLPARAQTQAQAPAPEIPEAVAPLVAAFDRAVKPGPDADTYRALLARVMLRVQRSYPIEFDPAPVVAAGATAIASIADGTGEPPAVFKRSMNAALAALDPHSNVLDASDLGRFRNSLTGNFGGLGIEIEMSEGLVRVVAPIEDSPAARAGIRAGDLIVKLDEQPVLGLTQADAVSKMRGEPGTSITLTLRRAGVAGDFPVPLIRDVIRSRLLSWRYENDVLVLRLTQFAGTLKPLIDKAVAEATASRAPKGVVLDLRGNPGGSVAQAVAVADAFLGQGEIVSMRGRTAGNTRSWKADEAQHFAELPMAVLLDGGSASASELVAGALQDNGRAIVIGQRSFGKGSVQTMLPLGNNLGAIRLTTALYYTPSGRSVQRTGIGPDVELVPPQGAAAPRGGRREENRERALPGAQEPASPRARVEQSRCPAIAPSGDQALGCAVELVRAGAIDRFVATVDPQPAGN